MYNTIILTATLLLGQAADLDRSSFAMIPPTVKSSVADRFANNDALQARLNLKIARYVIDYIGNDADLRSRLVKRKVVDWIYNLEEIKGALSTAEVKRIDDFINKELDKNIKSEEADMASRQKNQPQPQREAFWYTYNGYNLLLNGWKDTDNVYRYYVHEQDPTVQGILNYVPPKTTTYYYLTPSYCTTGNCPR